MVIRSLCALFRISSHCASRGSLEDGNAARRATLGRTLLSLLVPLVLAVSILCPRSATAAVVCNSETGHCYGLNSDFGLPNATWPNANAAARTVSHNGITGHLAAVTSASENLFITTNFPNINMYFGLFQASGVEPGDPNQGAAGGWQWVTGEPFYSSATNTATDVVFHNWAPGEPNNCCGFSESVGGFHARGEPLNANGYWWNDFVSFNAGPFLIEFSAAPLAAPAVELDLPKTALMGSAYELAAIVTNKASVPIKVQLHWQEIYTSSPHPTQPPRGDSAEGQIFGTNADATLLQQNFARSWPWIGSTNPVDPLINLFQEVSEGSIWELLEKLLDAFDLPGEAASLASKVSLIVDLVNKMKSVSPNSTATIRYVVTTRYDRLDAPGFGHSAGTVSETITLKVPAWKESDLMSYRVAASYATVMIDSGVACIFWGLFPPNPLMLGLGTSALVGGLFALNDAKIYYTNAADPPDFQFTVIATPFLIPIPELDSIAASPWKDLATTENRVHALAMAEATSRNRADAALIAGDLEWQARQLTVAARYASDRARETVRASGFFSLIEPFIAQSLAPVGEDIIRSFELEGVPDVVTNYLMQLGWTVQEIGTLRTALTSAGTWPVDHPSRAHTALRISAIGAAFGSTEASKRAINIRTAELGQPVSLLTPGQEDRVKQLRVAVETGSVQGVPSPSHLVAIQNYLTTVRDLIESTNNFAALEADLEAALGALVAVQKSPVHPGGLQTIIDSLTNAGALSHSGLTESLRKKLQQVERRIASANFNEARRMLGAFINEVEAQRGKKVTVAGADQLIGYADYILEFLPLSQRKD